MIRWLWSRVMKWGWDYSRQLPDDGLVPLARIRGKYDVVSIDDIESGIDLNNPITFRVQAVSGGTLVETRWYDAKKDENERKLHIVTGEENLAEAIGRIVTMELLKR
jgi:hypothetical protein